MLVSVHTTLIRDQQNGLGFSIAGGKGSPPYKPNSDAIFISRITDGGVAQKDGKLAIGDKVISVSYELRLTKIKSIAMMKNLYIFVLLIF